MAATNGAKSPSKKVLFYSLLLTLQYGAQPLISKRCIGKEVIVTSSVLTCEIVKVVCALILMARDGSLKGLAKEWTLMGSLTASGLPAAIYALQNSLLQISYRSLDSLTFSILNQTKIFFTAFFTFIILRQKQSVQQIGALCLLIMAAVLLSVGEGSNKTSSSGINPEQVLFSGIIPVLVASVLSGLASSLCQWASQVKKHSSYLMTVEMSIVGSLCMLASTLKSPDGEAIKRHGFFHGWTALTLGFVIVSALLVTALLQFAFEGKPPSSYCLVALPLVISSISLYQKYPYLDKKKKKVRNAQPGTMKEVLSFCLEQTCSSAYKGLGGGLKFGLNLVDDVIHLQRLIFGALQEVKSSGRGLKKKLKLADSKVYFMMCWFNEQTQTPELLSCSSKFNSRK
ncbi:hypothetical protein IGI04_024029 [Brassica rapa subsp. trilocularis]|uniref:Uncharacterized protein n=1 Tax=Brassica rapa subsp. trilocularis TaxID=1813537 RepID=A0ABQ7M5K7_BRACM|nr:hypothetical protein IGI04_024029 [Brassica rapa subsp. trilocularis]